MSINPLAYPLRHTAPLAVLRLMRPGRGPGAPGPAIAVHLAVFVEPGDVEGLTLALEASLSLNNGEGRAGSVPGAEVPPEPEAGPTEAGLPAAAAGAAGAAAQDQRRSLRRAALEQGGADVWEDSAGEQPSLPPQRLVGQREGRSYAVWAVPGCQSPNIIGVHSGPRAWEHICSCIPGGRYRPGTDRLRRFPSVADAWAGYYAESNAHPAALEPRACSWA